MTPNHKEARELAEKITHDDWDVPELKGFRTIAQAYLDLAAKVELMTKALEFYAFDLVSFPEDQDMSEVHYKAKGYTALQGGKRAREVLERVRG